MLVLLNITVEPSNLRKKKKGTTIYYKIKIKCDIKTTHVIMELSNVRKKKKKTREPPNVRKEISNVMLELHNVRMEPSNVRKK